MREFYRRRLPHLQYQDGEYFVTFCLAGALPKYVVKQLKKKYQQISKKAGNAKAGKFYFKRYDKLLDSGKGELWLAKNGIAQIVADKIHSFDDEKYLLICYTIMPNHVHFLFDLSGAKSDSYGTSRDPAARYPVTNIMKLIKGATARDANIILNRTGSFWHHESYDHLIRNDRERDNIIRYILENPVKAGLTNSYNNWKWSYCHKDYLTVF